MPTASSNSRCDQLAALIACGGASLRMGTPKASLTWRGEPFLTRLTRQLATVASPVVVVAAPQQVLPLLTPATRRTEDPVEHQGPLAALNQGLLALQGEAELAFFCGCDAPLLVPAFVTRLVTLLDDQSDLVMVRWKDRLQGCALLLRVTLQPTVAQLLEKNHRRLLDLVDVSRCRIVDAQDLTDADPHLLTLRGVNTPSELEELQREWGWVE
ncbi:MAG: molybdenum cofactor guanylyltransferase [Planctomycetaceae bacterium]